MMPSSAAAHQVWIVDDDPDDQYFSELAFKRLVPSIGIKLLNDGEELLPALSQSTQRPSLVILDLNMPRLNGLETLAQLRSTPAFEDIPVIVLTTSSGTEDQQLAAQLGANGFLTKPPSMDLLIGLFKRILEDWQLN